MKRPTVASQKKVTVENLAALGAERLAEILTAFADTRPELKRRLRMELAAEQGADHLILEIDKRLSTLETSRSRVSWRQRPSFVRDLDVLRDLVSGRLASLDRAAALDRLWRFMGIARRLSARMRDKDGSLAAVFERAADDIAGLIEGADEGRTAPGLVEAIAADPLSWAGWLPAVLARSNPGLAQAALRRMGDMPGSASGWSTALRAVADAAGDIDAFASTYGVQALRTPPVAAEVARRMLAAGRLDEAGKLLQAAIHPGGGGVWPVKGAPATVDFDWESVWIDYLEQSGQAGAAQAARWASFERTLSVERAKAFVQRLPDFEDVEAEGRAFDHAVGHADFERGLRFLMEWPALPEAARMIQARPDDVRASDQEAELWASMLRRRQPAAAHLLLRKVAAAAFRRRDFKTCDRLTAEADAIEV